VAQTFPDTPPLWIQDLSRAEGGRLRPHRSHQSGRDVDIALYPKSGRALRRFSALPINEVDLPRTWAFIEALLRTGTVRYIFMDRALQTPVRGFARSIGWPEPWLNRIFQSPGGNRSSIIRHIRGHRDHLHIRFRCPAEDQNCVD
jgi:murein endopeptidase